MDELLKMEDADLHAILSKEDVHRNRDTNRYEFLQANIEDYAQAMTRKYMTYEVLYEDTYCKATEILAYSVQRVPGVAEDTVSKSVSELR